MRNIGMAHLKSINTAVLDRWIPMGSRVVYLDYPLHNNIGDLLIMLGTLQFFSEQNVEVRFSGTHVNTNLRQLKAQDSDIIILHGGGNFGDLYPEHQIFRERVVERFPQNRVVVMPQTVKFMNLAERDRSLRLMSRHKETLICTRDNRSDQEIASAYSGRRELVPDMAHQLWGHFPPPPDRGSRTKALLLMRGDEELGVMPEMLSGWTEEFVDWGGVIPWYLRPINRFLTEIEAIEGRSGFNIRLARTFFRLAAHYVGCVYKETSDRDIWVTSRLHGIILALLLDRPVVGIDNSYGKLSGYMETWRQQISPILMIDNMSEAGLLRHLLESANNEELEKRYRVICDGASIDNNAN